MKKLLALVLVLSVAPLASANFSLTANGGTFSISSDADAAQAFYVLVSTDIAEPTFENLVGGSLSDVTSYGTMAASSFNVTSIAGDAYVWKVNFADSTALIPAGAWGTYTATDGSIFQEGTGAVEVITDGFAPVGTLAVVPEPATMALLSLGALALRRKK